MSNLIRLNRKQKKFIRKIKNINKKIYKLNKNIFTFISSFREAISSTIRVCKAMWFKDEYIKHTGYTCFNIMETVDRMNGRKFELFCAELYRALGYNVVITPATNDLGRDLILKKNGIITFVECKRYKKGNNVGREILQKAYGSSCLYGADKTIIITTSDFTKTAYEAAAQTDNISLIGYKDILDMIISLNPVKITNIINKTIKIS